VLAIKRIFIKCPSS